MSRIIVIGDYIIDKYITYVTERYCHDVPVVKLLSTRQLKGGAAATAVMCEKLGAEVIFCSTGRISYKIRYLVDETICFRKDCDIQNDPEDIFKYLPKMGFDDLIILSDYGKGTVSKELIHHCLHFTEKIIVDPYPKVNPFEYIDAWLCCPNWDTYLFHTSTWQQYKRLCIKMDSRGACIIDGESSIIVPAKKVKVVDTCGAGDQWIAALAVATTLGKTLKEAVILANRAAAIKCTWQGSSPVLLKEWL